jgi:hypothetical protein
VRFQCIVSFRSSRSKTISNWRTSSQGDDVVVAAARAIEALKRRQRRVLDVVGIYLHVQEEKPEATAKKKPGRGEPRKPKKSR